jgi:hypothetical protein
MRLENLDRFRNYPFATGFAMPAGVVGGSKGPHSLLRFLCAGITQPVPPGGASHVVQNKEPPMKMRTVTVSLLGLLCAVSLASAQGRGGRGGGFGGRGMGMGMGVDQMSLLRVEKVRQELDLVDEQVAKIQDLRDSRRPGRGDGDRPNFQDMTREQVQEMMQQRRNEMNAELKKILLEDQWARLQQIYVQVAGSAAVTDEDVAAKLALTDDQKAQIQATRDEAGQQMFAQMRELRDLDEAARRDKMEELRKATDEKVLAHLTAEQKAQFESLKGEPLEISMEEVLAGRGGGRGFGFGGRGGGPGGGRRGDRGDRPDRPQRPE